MPVKIILFLLMALFVLGAVALILAGQYLYKEKNIKSGLRQAFYNSSVTEYPANQAGKRLLFWGQISAVIAIILFFILLNS